MKSFVTIASLKLAHLNTGQQVSTQGYYSAGDGGGATYLIVAPQAFDGYGDHELANGNIAVLQYAGELNVRWFGAAGDGVTDDTAAIQATIDYLPSNGGAIYAPNGRYLISTIDFPNDPKRVDLLGESLSGTVFKMATAGGPAIRKAQTPGRITSTLIQDFTIEANASSDIGNLSHIGLNFTGWTNSHFKRLGYKSDGVSSGGLGVFIYANASEYLTYQNTLEGLSVFAEYGPSRAVLLDDNGNYLEGPNVCEIRDSMFYACRSMTIAIEAYECTNVTIRNNIFEDCTGATAVGMAQNTLVEGNWFELMTGGNVTTNSAASIDGSGSTIIGNYMSDGTSFIDTINIKPLWIGNTGPGSLNVTGAGVIWFQAGNAAGASPSVPTLSVTAGSGTLVLVSGTTPLDIDATGRITFELRYTFTPDSAIRQEFTISSIADYTIENTSFAVIRQVNGIPSAAGMKEGGVTLVAEFISTDSHDIVLRATFKKNNWN